MPSVKAYRGPLPARRGIEFCTAVAPTPGTGTPYEARWNKGSPGVVDRQSGGQDYAAIAITYINNAQVP